MEKEERNSSDSAAYENNHLTLPYWLAVASVGNLKPCLKNWTDKKTLKNLVRNSNLINEGLKDAGNIIEFLMVISFWLPTDSRAAVRPHCAAVRPNSSAVRPHCAAELPNSAAERPNSAVAENVSLAGGSDKNGSQQVAQNKLGHHEMA